MFEIGYELKNVVKYIISSGFPLKMSSFNYANIAEKIKSTKDISPQELAKVIIQEMANKQAAPIITVVDLEKSENLASKIDSFAHTVLSKPHQLPKIKEKLSLTLSPDNQYYQSYKDLTHFMKLITQDPQIDTDIKQKAMEVIEALNQYVIAKEFDSNDKNIKNFSYINGISIETYPYQDYKTLMFSKTTKWDEMIEKLLLLP